MEKLSTLFFLPKYHRKEYFLAFLRERGMKKLSKLSVKQLQAIYIKERLKDNAKPLCH